MLCAHTRALTWCARACVCVPAQLTTLVGLLGYIVYRTKCMAGRKEQAWSGWDLEVSAQGCGMRRCGSTTVVDHSG